MKQINIDPSKLVVLIRFKATWKGRYYNQIVLPNDEFVTESGNVYEMILDFEDKSYIRLYEYDDKFNRKEFILTEFSIKIFAKHFMGCLLGESTNMMTSELEYKYAIDDCGGSNIKDVQIEKLIKAFFGVDYDEEYKSLKYDRKNCFGEIPDLNAIFGDKVGLEDVVYFSSPISARDPYTWSAYKKPALIYTKWGTIYEVSYGG